MKIYICYVEKECELLTSAKFLAYIDNEYVDMILSGVAFFKKYIYLISDEFFDLRNPEMVIREICEAISCNLMENSGSRLVNRIALFVPVHFYDSTLFNDLTIALAKIDKNHILFDCNLTQSEVFGIFEENENGKSKYELIDLLTIAKNN